MLPAEKSSVVTQKGYAGSFVSNAKWRGGSPLIGKRDGAGIGCTDERCGTEVSQDAAACACGTKRRCRIREAGRRQEELEDHRSRCNYRVLDELMDRVCSIRRKKTPRCMMIMVVNGERCMLNFEH